MRALVVCSARSGVGKTTVAVQLARALDRLGERTVLVDLDPLGPATAALAPSDAPDGPSLAAVLAGRWRGPAADLVRAGPAGPGVIPAVGLHDVAAVLAAGAETRLRGLVASLMGESTAVVVDCPGGPAGRVGPFTAVALAAVAPLGTSGGGVLAVMTPSGDEVAGTGQLLGRVPPGAVLGLVVNGVDDSTVAASHHDLPRHLGAPVLARIPAARTPGEASGVGHAVDQLAQLLASEHGATAAWSTLWAALDRAAEADEHLAGRLHAELDRLARQPETALDAEFELGLELLQGTPVHEGLVRRRDDVLAARLDALAAAGASAATVPAPAAAGTPAGPPSPATQDSIHDRLSRLAPWASRPAGEAEPGQGGSFH